MIKKRILIFTVGFGTGTSGGSLFGTSTTPGFGQASTAPSTSNFSFGQPNKTTGMNFFCFKLSQKPTKKLINY